MRLWEEQEQLTLIGKYLKARGYVQEAPPLREEQALVEREIGALEVGSHCLLACRPSPL